MTNNYYQKYKQTLQQATWVQSSRSCIQSPVFLGCIMEKLDFRCIVWNLNFGKLNPGHLDSGRLNLRDLTLDAWTLDAWTLNTWTEHAWTLNGWTLDVWTRDAWTPVTWTLNPWTLGFLIFGLWDSGRLGTLTLDVCTLEHWSFGLIPWIFQEFHVFQVFHNIPQYSKSSKHSTYSKDLLGSGRIVWGLGSGLLKT